MGRAGPRRAEEDSQGAEWEVGLAGRGGPDLQAVDSGLDPGLPQSRCDKFLLCGFRFRKNTPYPWESQEGTGFYSLLPTVCLQLAGQAEPCSTLSAGGGPPRSEGEGGGLKRPQGKPDSSTALLLLEGSHRLSPTRGDKAAAQRTVIA